MAGKIHLRKKKPQPQTERFEDGSQLVTYPNGSMMILESELAQGRAMRENPKLASYGKPQAEDWPLGALMFHNGSCA